MAEILVVDDDQDMSELICRKLGRLGHSPDRVHTIRDAFILAGTKGYDLIFLDINMPDGNGLDFLHRFKELPSTPEVIIISGMHCGKSAEVAIKNGAWSYLTKDSIIQDLPTSLLQALECRKELQELHLNARSFNRQNLIGESPQFKKCLEQARLAAASDASVLIGGETGTGKELFARVIHDNSKRALKNFVVVDCTALPENLVESVLFGHTEGAFTGAVRANNGLIKQADNGTLFLDEIGELPVSVQKKFLRVIQEKSFRPIGSNQVISCNFRLLAATNRNLEEMSATGFFRQDLLYRLKSVSIDIPPLRERNDDIKTLAQYFIGMLCKRYGQEEKSLSPDFLTTLQSYRWPGNVRELFQTLDHAFATAIHHQTLSPFHLPEKLRIQLYHERFEQEKEDSRRAETKETPVSTWRETKDNFEKNYCQNLLQQCQGNIQAASRISGLSRTRLYQMLKKHDLA